MCFFFIVVVKPLLHYRNMLVADIPLTDLLVMIPLQPASNNPRTFSALFRTVYSKIGKLTLLSIYLITFGVISRVLRTLSGFSKAGTFTGLVIVPSYLYT